MADFAQKYSEWKNGKGFIYTLIVYISLTLVLHILFNFDPGFYDTELVLSIEAAFALPVIVMAGKRDEEARKALDDHRRQELEYMKHLMEAVHAMLIQTEQRH